MPEHGDARGELVALRGGQVKDDRQGREQYREQGQRMEAQIDPAAWRQPLVVQRVDQRDECR